MRRTESWKNLTFPQLAKKFPAVYVIQRFITAFTRARHLSILSQINPVHALQSYLFNVLNITLLPMCRSSMWCLAFRFTITLYVPFSHMGHT
jgi:hypothetical protein